MIDRPDRFAEQRLGPNKFAFVDIGRPGRRRVEQPADAHDFGPVVNDLRKEIGDAEAQRLEQSLVHLLRMIEQKLAGVDDCIDRA